MDLREENLKETASLKGELLTDSEKDLFTDNVVLGLTVGVSYDIDVVRNQMKEIDSDRSAIEQERAFDKAEELIKVLEGALDRAANEQSTEKALDIIRKTEDAINKLSEFYNGVSVSFIPDDFDFLVRFGETRYELGEKDSYHQLFSNMLEREK